MHPLRWLLVYLVAVFVGGALLAPGLYELAQWGAAHYPGLQGLAHEPFHRYVNRSILALAIAALWPLLRRLEVRSWAEAGLVKPMGQWGRLGSGFALGLGSLAGVALLTVAAGARQGNWSHSGADYGRHLLSVLLTAASVGLLEELLFRGVIFGALRRCFSWPVALAISSAVYGMVHFFQRPAAPAMIDWASGLRLLPGLLHGWVEVEQLVPGFLCLTLAGGLLGLAYQRTGTLYYSIGLHAGWIFWIKWYGYLTQPATGANPWIWGTHKLTDGWLSVGVLGVIGWVMWRRWFAWPAAEKGA